MDSWTVNMMDEVRLTHDGGFCVSGFLCSNWQVQQDLQKKKVRIRIHLLQYAGGDYNKRPLEEYASGSQKKVQIDNAYKNERLIVSSGLL